MFGFRHVLVQKWICNFIRVLDHGVRFLEERMGVGVPQYQKITRNQEISTECCITGSTTRSGGYVEVIDTNFRRTGKHIHIRQFLQ